MFGNGRVEDVGSDDDESDGHGVGLPARRQTRFISDSLQFTGTDLGDRSDGVVRRGKRYQNSGDESDSQATSDNGESEDEDETEGSQSGNSQLSLSAREDALVQSALKRISRAQAQGRTDVNLNKNELAALERRRKRMQEEAERAERERAARASGSSGSDRKKKHKEQRVAVPLSQFVPVSKKERSGSSHPPRKDSLPSRSIVGDSPDQQVYPPMGYFPPPSQSRSRSSSHLQRPGSRARDTNNNSPPVAYYQYASGSSHRHASDSMTRSHTRGLPREDAWNPDSSLDPFQYQTDGARAAYPASSRGSRSEAGYRQSSHGHGTSSPATRSHHGSARPSLSRVSDSSETSGEDTASDELGNGAQIREQQQQQQQQQQQKQPVRGRRSRDIVVEVEPEPPLPPPPAKKKSSSPTKRKPAPNGKKKKR
ncbi:hypothetical protein CCM_06376 [Cordyceps militaris CM01]|uniref:COPII vesicles protein Yip3 n=1 Tax=Cordyceps militaris (strain CM01) TaxID=983644 RepID=G3JKD7_CORMM|nr:uncharacterized protein CCM_06376 [Cordyceps militaris CM01]EGX92215.1 hypothetical protein CCM_06376 [Cordyceps militaris CM01]